MLRFLFTLFFLSPTCPFVVFDFFSLFLSSLFFFFFGGTNQSCTSAVHSGSGSPPNLRGRIVETDPVQPWGWFFETKLRAWVQNKTWNNINWSVGKIRNKDNEQLEQLIVVIHLRRKEPFQLYRKEINLIPYSICLARHYLINLISSTRKTAIYNISGKHSCHFTQASRVAKRFIWKLKWNRNNGQVQSYVFWVHTQEKFFISKLYGQRWVFLLLSPCTFFPTLIRSLLYWTQPSVKYWQH